MTNLDYILIFLCLLTLGLASYLMYRLRWLEKEKKYMQVKYVDFEERFNHLQLETLESKLNPHLFKNILNSIQSHAYQTYFAMDKLSNVLDYILYESRKRFVSPKEEIEFALNLIEINKIKISPLFALTIKKKIDENDSLYQQQLMAPLISIDLIENAFKHADLQSADAFITVVIEFKAHVFSMTVTNKISRKGAFKKENSGLGSETLEQRLKIIYKNHYKLDKYVDGDVYFAQLKIDLREYKTQMLAS
ncbi:histidine kinase [Flavobacterium cerinum]|uniref:Histidine kinase n=1 Tax=Flavobacterium cerinum TaxID=2502784 RepID=A0ABY5INI2_9FLAO|nr:histidine kinase [Flavobacterium cerinum]UUC44304.1 histidine kinase [Flavobacterium cerinum]